MDSSVHGLLSISICLSVCLSDHCWFTAGAAPSLASYDSYKPPVLSLSHIDRRLVSDEFALNRSRACLHVSSLYRATCEASYTRSIVNRCAGRPPHYQNTCSLQYLLSSPLPTLLESNQNTTVSKRSWSPQAFHLKPIWKSVLFNDV